MTCHGIDSAVNKRGVASYLFRPSQDYLFADSDSGLLTRVNHFLIRIHPELHRREMARTVLSEPVLCATCHVQFMDKDMNDWGWVKMQDEYSAWLDSQYSGNSEHTFANESVFRCHDCHMPLVATRDPSANRDGLTRSHRTLGANTAVPAMSGDSQQLLLESEFLQSNKVRIDIQKPWRNDASQTGQFLNENIRAEAETPHYLYLGEKGTLEVSVANLQVGHNFPGGTTDVNEVWVDFTVNDADGRIIFESGAVDEQQNVDPKAYFYRSIPVDRNGQAVWRHDLFNMIGDSYTNIVKSGGSDVVEYRFSVPYWAKGPLTASALLRYRKFNNRYARWVTGSDTPNLPIVDMARSAIQIPVRMRPEAY